MIWYYGTGVEKKIAKMYSLLRNNLHVYSVVFLVFFGAAEVITKTHWHFCSNTPESCLIGRTGNALQLIFGSHVFEWGTHQD
jgi:hypothetical protein